MQNMDMPDMPQQSQPSQQISQNSQVQQPQTRVARPRKNMMKLQFEEKKPGLFMILLSIIIALIIVGFIVQLAWNESMPYIFNVRQIDFWSALCLFILTSVLFK